MKRIQYAYYMAIMNCLFIVWFVTFFSDQPLELLRIFNGTTIGLYNLWNLSSVSCGTETNTNDFFRSNIIDSYDPSSYPCPKFVSILTIYYYASYKFIIIMTTRCHNATFTKSFYMCRHNDVGLKLYRKSKAFH